MNEYAVGTNAFRYLAFARARPAEATLHVGLPVALAAVQVGNGLVNDVPPVLALTFALGLVAFAVAAGRHQRAAYDLERIAGDTW